MSTLNRRRIRRVALLVETTRTYTRELLSGVRRYIAAHGPWSTFLELRATNLADGRPLSAWTTSISAVRSLSISSSAVTGSSPPIACKRNASSAGDCGILSALVQAFGCLPIDD
jgi:LacI family transcriptional regulator